MGAPTVASMAELRVRQGRLAEAEQLLAGREEHPSSLCALAHLRIADGRPQVAAALLERALGGAEGDAIRTTQLLAPLVEARLACGDLEGARRGRGRLAELAEAPASGWSRRARSSPRRSCSLAAGRPEDAAEPARRALAAFARLGMPLHVGEARLALARALVTGAPEVARDEARTALAAFRELGASRAMDAAAAVLRELGEATGARPRSQGELTAREKEVLGVARAGDVQRADRADAGDHREDRRPPREPHPLQARRAQPRRGGRPRPRRRIGSSPDVSPRRARSVAFAPAK